MADAEDGKAALAVPVPDGHETASANGQQAEEGTRTREASPAAIAPSQPAEAAGETPLKEEPSSSTPDPRTNAIHLLTSLGISTSATASTSAKIKLEDPDVQTTSDTANSSSTTAATTRKPYVPQFSAATQMILARMRGEEGGFNSALASAIAPGAPLPEFSKLKYESVREMVIKKIGTNSNNNNNNGGSNPQSKPSSSTATTTTATDATDLSATLHLPANRPTMASSSAVQVQQVTSKKRKLGQDDAASTASSITEPSDYGEGIQQQQKKRKQRPTASSSSAAGGSSSNNTTTKSGRQILKPDTYDPAAEDKARRRNRAGGPRTTEQALCKKCTRMHSPMTNQMVFCDKCNDAWHQRCHEPWISDEVVADLGLKWYCVDCTAKRERSQSKKKVAKEESRLVSWAGKPSSQKLAHFQKLSQPDLIKLLMHATEVNPDLPLFPPTTTTTTTTTDTSTTAPTNSVNPDPESAPANGAATATTLYATASSKGLFSRAEANPAGPINFIRKIPAAAKKSTMAKARSGPGSLQSKQAAQQQQQQKSSATTGHQLVPLEEDASYIKLWPRPGKGMYSRLVPDADDDRQLVDKNDYDAFSVIVYNEKGKKIEENGVRVKVKVKAEDKVKVKTEEKKTNKA